MPHRPSPLLIELAVTNTGERYRIANDGRFLVTGADGVEHEQSPMSKVDRGTARVTPQGMERIRAAIAAVGFDSLPVSVAGIESLPPGARPAGGGNLEPRTFVFTVHEGETKAVSARADARIAQSFGVLAPLWKALDEEALGGWRHE